MKGWTRLSQSQIILEVIPVQEVKMDIIIFLMENGAHSLRRKVNLVPAGGGGAGICGGQRREGEGKLKQAGMKGRDLQPTLEV